MLTHDQYAMLANFALAAVSMAKDETADAEFKALALSFIEVCNEAFGASFLVNCVRIRDGEIVKDRSPSYLSAVLAVAIANRKTLEDFHMSTVAQAFVFSLQEDSGLSVDEFAEVAQILTRNKPTFH